MTHAVGLRGLADVVVAAGRLQALGLVLLTFSVVHASAGSAGLPRLAPAPNFALTTQQNDRVWLTQLRERVVVLTFFCTTCDACPGLRDGLLALSRSLGSEASRQVFFVAVSVDPARDTTPALRRFARDHRADLTRWLFLTGGPAQVDVVTRWYGVEVRRDEARVHHACVATLIDRAGLVRARYDADDVDRLRRDLATLLAEPRVP